MEDTLEYVSKHEEKYGPVQIDWREPEESINLSEEKEQCEKSEPYEIYKSFKWNENKS